jgi:anti-sigma factor RsiW
MARDDWHERLEACLDGELDPAAAAAFVAETAADPELQAALAERRAFRDRARSALAGDVPAALIDLVRRPGQATTATPMDRRDARRRPWRRWPVLALAATLALAFVVPALLRNEHGAEGPRSTITRAGQVAAIRFGEQPGETVTLEAGWHDQSSDPAQ